MMKKTRDFILIAAITFFLLEIVLRLMGNYTTYSEQIGDGYITYYNKVMKTWYHGWPSGKEYILSGPEFKYINKANSLGFRDKEWQQKKPDSTRRLIVLGDSYTEGIGTSQDSAFPVFLERQLNNQSAIINHQPKWEVYNGGVSGNDPFYNYKFIETRLPDYEYDAVMVVVNYSDVTDYIFRGGLERFHPDSTTHNLKSPWWEPLYHYSHTFRALMTSIGYSQELLTEDERTVKEQKALTELPAVLKISEKLVKSRDKKFIVVFHSDPASLKEASLTYDRVNKLLPFADKDSVPYINIIPCMYDALHNKNLVTFGWPVNKHYNGAGYEVFAACVFKNVNEKYPDFFK